jgi:hypothetical protein
VHKALLAREEPTIVVAHRHSGSVVAEAAAGMASVKHLILISSSPPEVEQSLSDFRSDGGTAPLLKADLEAGTFTVRPEFLAPALLQDCRHEIQDEATRHLALQSLRVTGEPVTASAWHEVPSTYFVCVDDQGTPAALQREFALRVGSVVEMASGYHPFRSQFAAVRDLLLSL